jgi:hypothetical protein
MTAMKPIHVSTQPRLSRRHFLRAAGVSLSLPMLEAMTPAFAKGSDAKPRRMVAVCTDLGMMPDMFFPKGTGKDYTLSPYLNLLKDHRSDFTVFSGVSHPEVDGAHAADKCFLTAAPHPTRGGFRNTISLDQLAAQQIGHLTRFPSLTLVVGPANTSLSWTSDGVQIPGENRASKLFDRLFFQGSKAEIEAQIQRLREGRSLMDAVADRTRSLQRDLGPRDKERLDQYFTAVRDFEKRLAQSEAWETQPKPQVSTKAPADHLEPDALIPRTRAMFEVVRLALETDSTRLISVLISQGFNPKVDLPGVTLPHHALTHQGGAGDSRTQLRTIEEAQLKELKTLITGLKSVKEQGATLLDRTMLLYGSNLGNAATHGTTNLPTILAGGGFKHGQHLAFDPKNNTPLCNLYVTMLQCLGIEVDKFSSSTGTLSGLKT